MLTEATLTSNIVHSDTKTAEKFFFLKKGEETCETQNESSPSTESAHGGEGYHRNVNDRFVMCIITWEKLLYPHDTYLWEAMHPGMCRIKASKHMEQECNIFMLLCTILTNS